MIRQKQILVTVTYNDLGCIIDTKTEPYEEPNLQPTCNHLAIDTISRQAAIEHLKKRLYETELNSTAKYPYYEEIADNRVDTWMNEVPSAEPERKTGAWIDHSEDGFVECPFCHSATNCDGNRDELHYCFSCGAELR